VARFLGSYFKSPIEVITKADGSFVSKADKEAEEVSIQVIKSKFPSHGIVGEESGAENEDAEYQWYIDPLDGMENFLKGIPLFAISIGVVCKGELIAGVVYNPITNFLVCGEKDEGVFWNGRRAHVSATQIGNPMISFGAGRKRPKDRRTVNHLFIEARRRGNNVRYLGSTALDLALLACGKTQACAVWIQRSGITLEAHFW
jgi:myo-inositol-1(or 4)-monophosphatase